jgi:hypothetical protein
MVDARALGIPDDLRGEWEAAMGDAFAAYEKAVAFWEGIADTNPDITRIPETLWTTRPTRRNAPWRGCGATTRSTGRDISCRSQRKRT